MLPRLLTGPFSNESGPLNPRNSTKSRLPDAGITKGRSSHHLLFASLLHRSVREDTIWNLLRSELLPTISCISGKLLQQETTWFRLRILKRTKSSFVLESISQFWPLFSERWLFCDGMAFDRKPILFLFILLTKIGFNVSWIKWKKCAVWGPGSVYAYTIDTITFIPGAEKMKKKGFPPRGCNFRDRLFCCLIHFYTYSIKNRQYFSKLFYHRN